MALWDSMTRENCTKSTDAKRQLFISLPPILQLKNTVVNLNELISLIKQVRLN